MESFKITKIKGNTIENTEALLVEEIPLTIISGENELATFLCTPEDIEDLIYGFLFTSGLIINPEDIKKISIDRKRWIVYVDLMQESIMKDMIFKRVYTSGCGRGIIYYNAFDLAYKKVKINSNFTISSKCIFELMSNFQKKSHQFVKTGGVHSAALADDKNILVFKEDIGRHNAIDKVIGYSIKKNIHLHNKVLLTTGRISSEVLFKIQKINFPMVISRGAPSNHAIKLAREMNITVAGFVRAKSMNIYSAHKRILVKNDFI